MTLVEFLTARLGEDEAQSNWQHRLLCLRNYHGEEGDENYPCNCGYPARVLAEVEAKRLLLNHFGDMLDWGGAEGNDAGVTLHALASIYADHPDYQQEWRP